MVHLQINQKMVEVPAGTNLLQAARKLGVSIPTLCYLEGYPHFTSCMLCLVEEVKSKKLLPSCSVPAADGMVIETDSEKVHHARKSALELLLSDHVGDCLGPCQRTCPAHMNIPLMNMHIETGRMHEALVTVKAHIALPAVLGRICSAPCEHGCRRRTIDSALSICALKCFVADEDLKSGSPYLPECKAPTAKKVAIIGSGPAGLSAAYYLLQEGHACTIFDKNEEAGGMLRYGVPRDILPLPILDAEIEIIRRLGAQLEMRRAIGEQLSLAELRQEFDAVILATGELPPEELQRFAVATLARGIHINADTHETSARGVFAGGGLVHPGKMAVRSVAHGRAMAISVNHYLHGQLIPILNNRSQSRIARLRNDELAAFTQTMDDLRGARFRQAVREKPISGHHLTAEQAVRESNRCVQCGCVSFEGCSLRIYAERYGADPKRYTGTGRRNLTRVTNHPFVVYEPGKCMQCGLCVRITEKEGEELGLTFIGRGFDVRVDVPLHESLGNGLQKTAEKCVSACPSGALVFKNSLCDFSVANT